MSCPGAETEGYFRALVEGSTAATMVLGPDGEIRYASPSAGRLLGRRTVDLIGENAAGLVHPEDREQFASDLRNCALGGCAPCEPEASGLPKLSEGRSSETRFRVGDGSWRRIEWTASNLLEHPGVRGLLWTGHDVSRHTRVEEELRFLSVLLENTLDAILVSDADGTARYVTPSVENLMGYKPEEMLGKTPADLLHPDDAEQHLLAYEEIASRPGGSGRTLARFLHKDGSWRWIEGVGHNMLDHPVIRGMLNSGRDVTRRREAEEEIRRLNGTLESRIEERTAQLKESEEQFRTAFEVAAVGMAKLDTTGRYLWANPKLCEIIGYTREQLLTRRSQETTHSDDLDIELELLRGLLERESETYTLEKRLIRGDRSRVWVKQTVSVSHGPSGDLKYLIQVTEDVTQRKEYQRLLEKLTPGEVEVLKHLALGRTNQEIAANTKFSFGTVKHRVQQITCKLGVSDRTQAAARAVELGLLSSEDRNGSPRK